VPEAGSFLPSADDILSQMGEAAHDEVGEAAEDWPDVAAEGKAALETLLKAWAVEHATIRFWTATGPPERIEPARAKPAAP
jgi:hypothetical protein